LIKRSGFDFAFLYLKEVMRLLIRALSGNPEPSSPVKGVMVKRDHNGLPTIIPSSLRACLLPGEWRGYQNIIVCILSIVSVYRVFPTKVKPKLDTVTDPFSGLNKTFDKSQINLALKELLGRTQISLSIPKLIKLETASPNTVKSAWGASIDALAFIDHPIALYNYIVYMWYQKSYGLMLWPVFLILISSPIFVVLRAGGWLKRLNMGKLSVVYDQAGKARIVAITNWWIQLALKPLHKAIFGILRGIKQDGTFDQLRPFNELIDLNDDDKFYSFDLSAATDTLPIDLQRDILNCLSPNLGSRWFNLLNLPWYWQGKEVRYAVGQPMGAYSSWAMLALTHHVIVRIAAHRVGVQNFSAYCILGDDVVIRNDLVADEYYKLMSALGVSINLSKSVNSTEFAEFAKNWKGPDVNITPIGPGLTLRFIRDKKYIAKYILEAWKLNIFNHFSEVLAFVERVRDSKAKTEVNNILWSSFGLNGYLVKGKRYIDEKSIMYCFSALMRTGPTLDWRLCNTLRGIAYEDIQEATKKLEREEEFFNRNWWRTFVTTQWPQRLLEAFLKVFGPGFWIYWLSFERSRSAILRHSEEISKLPIEMDSVWKLVSMDPALDLSSIDWTQKDRIKENSRKMRRILAGLDAFNVKSFYTKTQVIEGKRAVRKIY
jgi:hypothetical protein